MSPKRYSLEEFIAKLREADVALADLPFLSRFGGGDDNFAELDIKIAAFTALLRVDSRHGNHKRAACIW